MFCHCKEIYIISIQISHLCSLTCLRKLHYVFYTHTGEIKRHSKAGKDDFCGQTVETIFPLINHVQYDLKT